MPARIVLAAAVLLLIPSLRPALAAESVLSRTVQPGQTLEVRNYAGAVSITSWEREDVEIRATHPPAESIILDQDGLTLRAVARSWQEGSDTFEVDPPERGRARLAGTPPQAIDYVIRVPGWLPVSVEGPMNDVTIQDLDATVGVAIFSGAVEIRGGRGDVSITSLAGDVLVDHRHGRVRVAGTRDRVTLRECQGELQVETTAGDIELVEASGSRTEAATVTGGIVWSGSPASGSIHDLTTHGGEIVLRLPSDADLALSASTFRGRIESGFAAKSTTSGRELRLTLGSGAARLDARSFSGVIRLVRRDVEP